MRRRIRMRTPELPPDMLRAVQKFEDTHRGEEAEIETSSVTIVFDVVVREVVIDHRYSSATA